MRKIYFDHNSTSPVHPLVRQAMLPFLEEKFGNPSSVHWAGREVRAHLDDARNKAAVLINADPSEIFFTAGGSEGDNWSIKGVLMDGMNKGGHIITTAVEHPAVLNTCRFLQRWGFKTTFARVDGDCMVDPEEIRRSIRKDTVLISVMLANNETGNIYPVKEICRIAHEHGILFHTDAVQGMGKLPIDVKDLEVDLLTGSGHKFNAPKGIGIQYIRKGIDILPFINGGHQEEGFRAGTENMAGIAGIGKACELATEKIKLGPGTTGRLRDKLERGILEQIPGTVLNGHREKRVYNTSNISFRGIEGEALLFLLDMKGIAVSTGSACSSITSEPSHVLRAMGLDPLCSRGSLRFSLGPDNTEEEIDCCLSVLPEIAGQLRNMSPCV
ncbi:MAG TPA: aminotransferase class V-fold PLP-dependent enzyme [Nitrospirota bacterium]|nr:aminotransferase class V-fold PLP-dependent enzyme [Nitrospirota bacterium]